MLDRMTQAPVIVDKTGNIIGSEPKPVPAEKWLQKMLPQNPELLPTGAIDKKYSYLLYITNEPSVVTTKIGKGHIDVLYISKTGHLVLVETKLYRNPESCREVIGQILDYAANTRSWTYNDVAEIYAKKHNSDLYHDLVSKYPDIEDKDTFITNVNKNLRQSDLLMMIVGDKIRPSVENMADMLNEPIDAHYHLALCEMTAYEMDKNFLVIPRLTTATQLIERAIITIESENIMVKKPITPTVSSAGYKYFKISNEEFVASFITTHPDIPAESMEYFLEQLTNAGFKITTGTKQIAIGLPNATAIIHIGDDKAWFTPTEVMKKLKTTKAVKSFELFMEEIKPLLLRGQSPYKVPNKFYKLDISVFTTRFHEFLKILLHFKQNLD